MKKYLILLLLSACSANGPVYNADLLPKDKQATVVIYRPAEMSGAATDWNVGINDQQCNISYNSFLFRSGISGSVKVTAEHWGAPGTTRLNFDTKPNRIYYVKLQVNDAKSMSGMLGGVIGYMAAEGISSNGGPFTLTMIAEEQAKEDLKNLRLQSNCE